MKITKEQLKNIIKEELESVLEGSYDHTDGPMERMMVNINKVIQNPRDIGNIATDQKQEAGMHLKKLLDQGMDIQQIKQQAYEMMQARGWKGNKLDAGFEILRELGDQIQ